MARNFVAASVQYLSRTAAVATAVPLTLAVWCKPTTSAALQSLVSLGDGSANNNFTLRISAAGKPQATTIAGGSAGNSTHGTSVTNGTWGHLAAVFSGIASRTVYFNGVAATADTTSLTPTGINKTAVGILGDLASNPANADMAEGAIWSVALDASEIAALAKGVSPRLIRPSALLAYWPIFGVDSPELDRWNGGYDLTVTGATKSDHLAIVSARGAHRFELTAVTATTRLIRIAGTDRTQAVDFYEMDMIDDVYEQPNTASFDAYDAFTPAVGDRVGIWVGPRCEFAGKVTAVSEPHQRLDERVVRRVTCTDHTWELNGVLITAKYGSQSASTTANTLSASLPSGFTPAFVASGLPTVEAIQFKKTTLPDAYSQLCDAFGGGWFCDEDKRIHLFETETSETPATLSTSNRDWRGFKYDTDISALANLIEVEGGGSSAVEDTAVGATTLRVESGDWYDDGGGSVLTGNQELTYTGVGSSSDFDTAWISRVGPTTALTRIAWSPSLGLFAAVSTGSATIWTSPDGQTWTSRTGAKSDAWEDICWSAELGLFCAVAANNAATDTIQTSPDGITWTSRTVPTARRWRGITWSPGVSLFVVVEDLAGKLVTSPDGITWTERNASAVKAWRGVAWSPSQSIFAAVAQDTGGAAAAMSSPDGITWTARTPTSGGWNRVRWSTFLSLFCAIGDNTLGMTSPDGITWTSRTLSENATWSDLVSAEELGYLVAVGSNGSNRVMVSTDGITWRSQVQSSSTVWFGVAWASSIGVLAASGNSGTVQIMTNTPTIFAKLTGIPASGAGSILYAISAGDEVNLLVTAEDATSQSTYGVRRKYIQDRRLSVAGAQARADAELALLKDPRTTATYTTEDVYAATGRPVPISMLSDWGISTTLTIQKVRKYFDRERLHLQKDVTASNSLIDRDLFRVLRQLQREIKAVA